ncbi:MAG: PIN domain-containing protein [Pirellulales bacterium]
MSAELALVDTNVFVYSLYEDSEHNAAAAALLERAQNGEVTLAVTAQILAEVYAVITNPRRVTNPYSPAEALDEIEKILAMRGLTLLSPPADLLSRWLAIARERLVRGGEIFDLQHAATMLGNGVAKIYTYNPAHFLPLAGIEVLAP